VADNFPGEAVALDGEATARKFIGSRQGNSSWQYRLSTKTAAQVRTPETVLQAAIEIVIFEPYDVTRDGKKFVVNTLSDMEGSLTLMVNWRSRLKQ
jgi:hypothetical protein